MIPGPLTDLVERWRRLFKLEYPAMEPHITLAYPPFISPNDWPLWRDRVAQVFTEFKPFEMKLHKIGIFETPQQVIWIKPDDGGALAKMRAALETSLPEFVPPLPFPYIPHVTIGFLPKNVDPNVAAVTIESEMKPIRFTIDSVSYVVHENDGPWQVLDVIALSDSGAASPR